LKIVAIDDLRRSASMNHTPIESLPEGERIYVRAAVASKLVTFLDPAVPWVWILDHTPNPAAQWWKATLSLTPSGSTFSGWVRNLVVDLQMPTVEFMARAVEFDGHGLSLIQSHERMPDTLSLGRIPEPRLNSMLKQNGATLRIFLPHAIETAQITSFETGYLAKKLGAEPAAGTEP